MNSEKPTPGQKWNLVEMMKGKKDFITMIGDYKTDSPAPFLNEMSIHFFRLNKGQADTQRPHLQAELYYVLSGSRHLKITADGKETSVELIQGDIVYVPARAPHKFMGDNEISLLVFFAPNYTGPEEA